MIPLSYTYLFSLRQNVCTLQGRTGRRRSAELHAMEAQLKDLQVDIETSVVQAVSTH